MSDFRIAIHLKTRPALRWLYFNTIVPVKPLPAVLQVFGEIAIVGSVAFLIIQLVSMINFVYVWNDAWLENEAR